MPTVHNGGRFLWDSAFGSSPGGALAGARAPAVYFGLVLRPALRQLLSEIMSDGSASVDNSPLRSFIGGFARLERGGSGSAPVSVGWS